MARKGTRKMKRHSRSKRGGFLGFFESPQYSSCKKQCDDAEKIRKSTQAPAAFGQQAIPVQGSLFGGRRRKHRGTKRRRSSKR